MAANLFDLLGSLRGLGFGLGYSRSLCRLLFGFFRAAGTEESNKLLRRYAQCRQNEEYKRQKQQYGSAVNTEGLFQSKGYERSENAGAEHALASCVEHREQLAHAAEIIDNDLRQQEVHKRARQKRQQQRRSKAPCAWLVPAKAENICRQQEHRSADPEAVTEQAL